VNHCFDLRPQPLVQRLLETTLGTHLINMTAFDQLTEERRARLFRLAASACAQRQISGYQAGAFVIGSLVSPQAPISFWQRFQPSEIAFLINEWVLHQKYLDVLEVVGEKRVARARDIILSSGLAALPSAAGAAMDFVPLKLSRIDLERVRAALPAYADPQSGELIDALRRPFGAMWDYDDPMALASLRRVCDREGVPLPAADDD
jgi:hypothetical protein